MTKIDFPTSPRVILKMQFACMSLLVFRDCRYLQDKQLFLNGIMKKKIWPGKGGSTNEFPSSVTDGLTRGRCG